MADDVFSFGSIFDAAERAHHLAPPYDFVQLDGQELNQPLASGEVVMFEGMRWIVWRCVSSLNVGPVGTWTVCLRRPG